MVTKTREKLIEVARQLFAHKGIENTTMNDIAAASDKGRRTIYTYFKNKREIYNAVIERESDNLVSRLREVVDSNLEPLEKLRKYLDTRFDIIDEAVHRQDSSLSNLFGRDFRRVDKIRRMAITKESELFSRLIREGVATGDFDAAQAGRLLMMETMVFQGVDYSHLRNNFNDLGIDRRTLRSQVVDFMVDGVKKHDENNE